MTPTDLIQNPDAPPGAAWVRPAGRPPVLGWVPIRALAPRHRPKILAHLLDLGPEDRHLRFGHPATDAQIARYVDGLDFERDEVFGIFNRRLELLAMAHLASLGEATAAAEFGVSVASRCRGRGWGARLFERAMLHARNAGVRTLHVHALAQNAAMLHIARAAGARVSHEGPDVIALVPLPPQDLSTQVEALMERHLAEFDHAVKAHALRMDRWLGLWQWTPRDPAEPPGSGSPGEGDSAVRRTTAPPPRV